MTNINAIKFISEGTSIISLIKMGEQNNTFQSEYDIVEDYNYISFEYSYNGIDWIEWDLNDLTVNLGDTLYIRGNNPEGFNSNFDNYYSFAIEGDKVSCSGNIMSLIDYESVPDTIPNDYCFYKLFDRCPSLTTAPELPAKTLKEWCYGRMFEGCTSLTSAPELPATRLANNCYYNMFKGCTLLNDKK